MSATATESDSKGLLDSLTELTKDAFAAKLGKGPQDAPDPDPEPNDPPKDKIAPEPKPDAKNGIPEPEPDTGKAAPDPDDTPEGLTPKAKADWKGLRESRKKAEERASQAETEANKLKARIAELESTHNPAEVETLRKQLEDYEQRLTVVAVEHHPKFQKYFNERTATLLDTAKKVGGEKIASLLQLPEGEYRSNLLREEFAQLDPVSQSRLGAIVNSMEELTAQRQSEIARSSEVRKALEAEEQARAKQQTEHANRILEETLNRWSDPKDGVAVLQSREGDKAWNDGRESIRAQAREIFNGKLPLDAMAKAATWAAIGPELAKNLKGATATIAQLQEQIAQLKAAKPTLDGGSDAGEDAGDSNMGFLAAVNKAYKR